MAGVVEDVGARMAAHLVQEALEGRAVVQVLARMDLVAAIDALVLEDVQDRLPATASSAKASSISPPAAAGHG